MKKQKKRILTTILFILAFLVGLSILLYPTISNKWNEYRASRLISSYQEEIENGDTEQYEQLIEDARAYNKKLTTEIVPDAFSIRDGVEDNEYETLLNLKNDLMMGYVEIPTIDVMIPIYHYTTEEVLQKGAGHLFGSSLPVGGETTHAIISAHRGLPTNKLFSDLDLVETGDVFFIHIFNEIFAYQVDSVEVVLPEETDSLAIHKGLDEVTLVTCTPYAVNTHRILVHASRIEYSEEVYTEQIENTVVKKASILPTIICVVIGVLIALVIVYIYARRLKKKSERNSEHEKKKKSKSDK